VQDHILNTAGDALTLHLYHTINFKERERERKKREREKESSNCLELARLNAMKEQRTPNCLLGLCTTQKKKHLSLPHTSSLLTDS
jgi:RIO-like serine/threonine protein kinase